MVVAERGFSASRHGGLHTAAEYLALEDLAEEKSEYIHGSIRPRPGGTYHHGLVMVGLGCAFHQALHDSDYLTTICDLKVGVRDIIYYPEMCIFAEPVEFYEGNNTVITNPLLTAEVIAPKTEARDRGEKFRNYLSISSLQVYLLISQSEPRIEMYSRIDSRRWSYLDVTGLDSVLEVPSLSVSVALSEIYRQVTFNDHADNTQPA